MKSESGSLGFMLAVIFLTCGLKVLEFHVLFFKALENPRKWNNSPGERP